ncbi:tRNA 2-thiouridine(34) synthase MnmA [Acetatifactor muris]|uniref:tRNA 2-thiouridine(34) synthase MnmA n=1 Tax=Acetatifactor muris TaxID=879566 RepID=UPI0023F4847F|nr:tRNA 2-thiouridine(34) synthase MnmA [Acetatifactor muris]
MKSAMGYTDGKKVVVGMSGGVDSSVAAWLLKKQGYQVTGVTMRLWQEKREDVAEDAARVAEAIGIPHYVMDFEEEFKCHVVDYLVEEYLRGRTPNPCIACNRHVKWEALLKRSLALGADYIATGHYARVERLSSGRYAIRRSVTGEKDQTYALYRLTQEQLAHTLMPVGEYEKSRIRAIAQEAELPVAHKPDSQEICFIPDQDYASFIDRQAGKRVPGAGNFVDSSGNVLGRHKGITHYTIGQRRGLELAAGKRIYVTDIRQDTNEVVLGRNEDTFTEEVFCDNLCFMAIEDLKEPLRVFAKIRYNHKGEYCRIEKAAAGKVRVIFEKPVRAATPGQSVCFYDGEYVLGGGIIIGSGR